jgi:hypothetical protein
MIRLSSVLAGLALGALVAPASAQSDIGYVPVSEIQYAHLDLATHTLTMLPGDPDTGDSNPTVLYDNATTNGYFSTGGGTVVADHHVDWGTFTTTSGLGANITEFRMAYVTAATSGTLNMRMRLYQGTADHVLGTVVGDFIVGPLPLSTGGSQGFLVDVTLPSAITLLDGNIGWSYNADNPVGFGTTTTGPFLAGPPNGAGTGVNKGAPATGFGAYQKYSEATDSFISTSVGASPVVLSLAMRLKGREIGAPPPAWVNYGDKNKVTLTGDGSATPGSLDNVIHVKCNPAGKDFVLVAGITQADFVNAHLGLHFQAFPWLVQLAPITTPVLSGAVDLPAPFPVDVPVSTNIYMQVFAQNLAGAYKNWSEGLQVTVQ